VEVLASHLPQLPLLLYFLNNVGEFQMLSTQEQTFEMLAKHPCGFSTVARAQAINNQYFIVNTMGDLCICQPYLKNCTLSQSLASELQQVAGANQLGYPPQGATYIMLSTDKVVVTQSNGNISLQNMDGEIFDSIDSGCLQNTTQALLFEREFFDDSLLVFCEGAGQLTQYLIRNSTFLFNRVVPLYGFSVRYNGTFISGNNYVFIEVDFDP
jgi:hypothetical protein